MKKIKNWKLFNESVEDSLEDVKWFLIDYDNIVTYDYYLKSTQNINFWGRYSLFCLISSLERGPKVMVQLHKK